MDAGQSRHLIQTRMSEAIKLKEALAGSEEVVATIAKAAEIVTLAFKSQNKILFCGNGGSAADAQHLAAELSGRFAFDRKPLAAEALHVNTSYVTAVANDYSYDEIYARAVTAHGKRDDVLWALSTSGNSRNVLKAIDVAKQCGMKVFGMTGQSGGEMRDLCDLILRVPSNETPRIQESHILAGHIICEIVEASLFQPKEA